LLNLDNTGTTLWTLDTGHWDNKTQKECKTLNTNKRSINTEDIWAGTPPLLLLLLFLFLIIIKDIESLRFPYSYLSL
jgi:hypothetical protein